LRRSLHSFPHDALPICQRLRPGAKLPSSRWLAARLRVSRNTVLRAYEALLLDGLLVAKVGSGTHVTSRHGKAPPIKIPELRTLRSEEHTSELQSRGHLV